MLSPVLGKSIVFYGVKRGGARPMSHVPDLPGVLSADELQAHRPSTWRRCSSTPG